MPLCFLPNLQKHSRNFPHQLDADKIFVQVKTMKTVFRIGHIGPLPTASTQVTMSLRDGSGEITAARITSGQLLYKPPVSSNSMTRELRSDVRVLPVDESDGGKKRAACVAEATFEFTFNVTSDADISGGNTATKYWMRFTVEGTDLYVESDPFRLVAKKDPVRDSMQTHLVSALTSFDKVPFRDGRSPSPSSDPTPSSNPN